MRISTTARRGIRSLAFAMALACTPVVAGTTPAAAGKAPDVAADAEGAWRHFLATGDFEKAYPAYEVLRKVGYSAQGVDAAGCRAHADALRTALEAAPVSVALHRAAMQCAEAVGDQAGAEREFKAVAALAKLAVAAFSESRNSRPVRVLRGDDAYALLQLSGYEFAYEYYELPGAARYYPMVVAARESSTRLERHLRFDFIDPVARIARDPVAAYPYYRTSLVEAFVQGDSKNNDTAAVDALAWRDARGAEAPKDRIAKLRIGAAAGGMQSARVWVAMCAAGDVPKDCADGLVDALLPYAEKEFALPMTLVAFAYANGLGVDTDAGTAEAMLAAADKRWSHMGGSVEYVRLWMQAHEDAPLPPAQRKRLEAAMAAGNENARLLLIRDKLARGEKASLDEAEVAYLSLPAQNGMGQGYGLLASVARDRDDQPAAQRWMRLAAEAGDPDAQDDAGYALAKGEGVARDVAAGERLMVEAAHGGNGWSARYMAYRSMERNDYPAAEKWLLDSATRSFDIDSLLLLASVYASGRPGLGEPPEKAIRLYRALADMDVAEARRNLARGAMFGEHMPKDPAQARRWLLQDAEKGDHESEGQLGLALLNGHLGAVEEREGVRWVERAIAGGDRSTASDYGYWLYYRKGTAEGRARALTVWRAGLARDDYGIANNLAWVLCTTPFDDLRDPAAGLKVAAKLGDAQDMDIAELDTMAACHAANGDFPKARELQALAVDRLVRARAEEAAAKAAQSQRAKDKVAKASAARNAGSAATEDKPAPAEDPDGYQARLALYAAGKPYRDPVDRTD